MIYFVGNLHQMTPIEKSRFLALYCMILADGIVEVKELEQLNEIAKRYGLTEEEVSSVLREGGIFETPILWEDKLSILYDLALIAVSDNNIDPSERKMIAAYALKMGFREENVEEITNFLLMRAQSGCLEADVIAEIRNS